MSEHSIRLRIDGSWSAKEMADLFQSCDTIYRQLAQLHSRTLFNEVLQQTENPQSTGNHDGRDKVLQVTSVSYSSPGWADFLGAGELVGHLKEFLLGLLDRVIEKRDREQGRQLRQAEIEAAALENYARRLELIDKAFDLSDRRDLSDGHRQQMLHDILAASRPLGRAISEGRITAVENVPSKTNAP